MTGTKQTHIIITSWFAEDQWPLQSATNCILNIKFTRLSKHWVQHNYLHTVV